EANDMTDDPGQKSRILLNEVKASLRPELFNRLDEVICFNSLGQEIIERVVMRNIDELRAKLADEHGVEMVIDPESTKHLAAKAYDPVYGARPVERTIQRLALSPVARLLITEEVRRGQRIKITSSEAEELKVEVDSLA